MSFFSLLLAAGSLAIGASAIPVNVNSSPAISETYRLFVGKAIAETWPKVSDWIPSYETMFNKNMAHLRSGCSQWGVPDNSEEEIDDLRQAIKQVSTETQVDARFILAVVLQESTACVRAPTTSYGHRNPGLMQSHNGAGTCNENKKVVIPCPAGTILTMIRDGVAGTIYGDGLVQLLRQAPLQNDMKYYQAARMYNSGEIDPSGELERGIATHCYASDIANRLTGWSTAAKKCSFDNAPLPPPPKETPSGTRPNPAKVDPPTWLTSPTAKPPPRLPSSESSPIVPKPSFISPVIPKPIPGPTQAERPSPVHGQPKLPQNHPKPEPPKVDFQPKPKSTSLPSLVNDQAKTNSRIISSNRAPGVTDQCAKFYKVQPGDFCNKIIEKTGVSFANLRVLNAALDAACSNLWLGYDYCIQGL